MALFRPYYYGNYKWDNYLLDIQETIESGKPAQQRSIQLQEKALDVAHEHVEELRQQTEQLHHIEEALHGGLEELRAEFQWGFTLLADRMERQIEQLAQIAAKLDAIHKTLQSPLLTQARELFQLGQERFRKGLLDKALEAYLQAEQKNEVDFPLQLQIGKLFLYGRDEDDNVLDLPQAERHLLLAARYADAEKGTFPQWNDYCGQAYFHAAVAAYLIGQQEQAAGHPEFTRGCLERALGYLSKAAILWPRFTETIYTQAKCHALLGQKQEAQAKLEILSDRDRRYFAKTSEDGDFEPLRAEVEELFTRATISPGPLARMTQAKVDEVAEAVTWARKSAPTSGEELTAIESVERELADARRALPTLHVDIEGLWDRLSQMRSDLDKITQRSLKGNAIALQQSIISLEQRKRGCESSIENLKKTMAATSGTGMGCLFAAIFTFGAPVLISIFVVSLSPGKNEEQALMGNLMFITMIAGPILAALIGSKLSRNHQNRPHKRQVEENVRALYECNKTLPSLREQAEAWTQHMRSFAAWQARRPLGPSDRIADSTTPRGGENSGNLAIILLAVGANKINVIKAVREVTGLGLKEAKGLVDSAPQPIKRGVNREEAEAIRREFIDAGARVEIK